MWVAAALVLWSVTIVGVHAGRWVSPACSPPPGAVDSRFCDGISPFAEVTDNPFAAVIVDRITPRNQWIREGFNSMHPFFATPSFSDVDGDNDEDLVSAWRRHPAPSGIRLLSACQLL